MHILIDECLPRKLKRELPDHEVATVQEMGWSGVKNGALLRKMTGQFDVFVTIDGNLEYQQNLSKAKIAVIVLKALNSKIESLLPLMPAVREKLSQLQPGEIARFGDTT
jgi:predicted nuclease of predicted toxin-antitoxin system